MTGDGSAGSRAWDLAASGPSAFTTAARDASARSVRHASTPPARVSRALAQRHPLCKPAARHPAGYRALLGRHALYVQARQRNPARWTRKTRGWSPNDVMALNPARDAAINTLVANAGVDGIPASGLSPTTVCGRLQVATNGCFVDAQPGRGRPQRQAALEKPDGRDWVDSGCCQALRVWPVSSGERSLHWRAIDSASELDLALR